MQLSYWEKQGFFSGVDICVIGSGIVGLSAAIECKRRFPSKKILVIERSFLPYGASTRNAGFACFGSVTELADDLRKREISEVVALAERRFKGLNNLRKLLGDEAIGYRNFGGYEIFETDDSYENAKKYIPVLNKELENKIGSEVYREAPDACSAFGFKGIKHAIYNPYEAQIDTGRMMSSLMDLARKEQIIILNGIGVDHFDGTKILTDHDFDFHAEQIIITTNGFARQLLPGLEVDPARAQVVVTSPVKDLPFKGTFHYDKGYYYFRNLDDNRVLFGGGRNLDFEREKTYEMDQTVVVMEKLENMLRNNILPGRQFTIDMQWSGIMGVGEIKEPVIRQVDDNKWVAVRMGGMGVALGSLVGKEVAGLL